MVQLAVALALGIPVAAGMCLHGTPWIVADSLLEYVQFISLLLALFVVSGGIYIGGDVKAQPHVNTIFLAAGSVLSSFIGTTGSAMLLIRPILRTNQQRRFKVHTVIFTIFIIANSGGLLTPLGDPPLFLGFLRGVPFTWTFSLLPEWLFMNGLLLLIYWGLDRRAYALESEESISSDDENVEPIHIEGKAQIFAFLAIIASVALLPSVDLKAVHAGTAAWHQWLPIREAAMLFIAAISYKAGSREVRFVRNAFVWAPIAEVACLFIGIFLTMAPALKLLGEIAPSLPLGSMTMMALTGGLSSVLDNAPTYATFFEMARQIHVEGAAVIGGVPEIYLRAISMAAVFGGAFTYIGNGPNFMVKAVAESADVEMPSFGGYILKWSFSFYLPIFAAAACIFVADSSVLKVAGAAVGAFMAIKALICGLRNSRPKRPIQHHENAGNARPPEAGGQLAVAE